MRIKSVAIKAFADDFEQMQGLTYVAGLILLLRYFDGTWDHKAAAAPIKVRQMFLPECIAFVRWQPMYAAPHEVEQAYSL